MRKVLLWIFGLAPAVACLLYTVFFTIMALLAAPSAPGFAVTYAVIGALIIWGTTTIVLLILDKPAKNAKYGLVVVIVALLPAVLGGFSGIENLSELAWFLPALSLLVVTIYLLRSIWRGSKETPA